MDIPREQEQGATSEQVESKTIVSHERNEDRASSSTESSLSKERDITCVAFKGQKCEGEARAGKITVPKTQRGKENSKHNALKHGIFSQVVLLEEDPRAEYDSLLKGLRITSNLKERWKSFLPTSLLPPFGASVD